MIIFSLSGISLNKALGAAPPPTGVSIPGGGGGEGGGRQKGPGGKEKEGHKYIHRDWVTDHWEYEYKAEPHPERHGIDFSMHEMGHSMMLPEHMSATASPQLTDVHDGMSPDDQKAAFMQNREATAAHQEELKEAYNQTRAALIKPGMRWQLDHPTEEGRKIDIEVVPAKGTNFPMGYKIVAREPSTTDEGTGEEKRGKKVKLGKGVPAVGASTLAALEKWYTLQKYTEHRYNPHTGDLSYSIHPNLGEIDRVNDRLKEPESRSGKRDRYFVAFPRGSHENIHDIVSSKIDPKTGKKRKSGSAERMGFPTWDDTLHQVAIFEQARDTENGAISSMSDLLATKSPLEIARGEKDKGPVFPRVRDPNRAVPNIVVRNGEPTEEYSNARKANAAFDSPEQKAQMFESMKADMGAYVASMVDYIFNRSEHREQFTAARDRLEPTLVGGGEDGVMGSILADALDSAFTRGRYKPHKGAIEPYVMKWARKELNKRAFSEGLINADQRKGADKETDVMAAAMDKDVAAKYERGEAKTGLENVGFGGDAPVEFNAEQEAKLNERIGDWQRDQISKLEEWNDPERTESPKAQEEINQMKNYVQMVNDAQGVEAFANLIRNKAELWYETSPETVTKFNEDIVGLVNEMVKSLTAIFVEHIAMKALQRDLREQIIKAKVTQPDPAHEYVRREGMDDNPSYLYRDPRGNYVRYTNAPEGSADYSPFGGAPRVHASEPSMDMAPEYFTPDGRKLTRAPHPAAQIQWNPNYHANDPQNLWAGRWVNPVTGEHEYTYVDSDIQDSKKLRLHQMNRLVDTRIPHLRRYTSNLLHSDQPKDNVVGLVLAMVDQGRVHPVELAKLKSGDIEMHGDIIRFGRFAVHAGEKIQQIVHRMMTVRQPEDSFFSAPVMQNDPDSVIGIAPDYRTIGPHYVSRILNHVGTSLEGLLAYHATQTYSMQLQRCIQGTNVSLKCGHEFALLEVARRMGHDFENEPDVNPVIKQILETMIDPVAVEVMEQNAKASGDDQGSDDMTRQVEIAVPHVSANLQSHTNSEKEFSSWLHNHPFHEHAEVKRQYEAA